MVNRKGGMPWELVYPRGGRLAEGDAPTRRREAASIDSVLCLWMVGLPLER